MNLSTRYLGLDLRSPVVVSACTLSSRVDQIAAMEDAGAGAVVLFSVFEEQIRREQRLFDAIQAATSNVFAEASHLFPDDDRFHTGTDDYLELIAGARERCDLPIIASLNGVTPEGWVDFARQMAEAGADAIELNVFHIPAGLHQDGSEVEAAQLDIVSRVSEAVAIPVALKLNPYFSAPVRFADRAAQAGARGLVLFNRVYPLEIDIEQMAVRRSLSYSEASETRLPLLWIGALHGRTGADLAANTGVEGHEQVIQYLLAGADVVMTASSLYRHGIEHLRILNRGLAEWMDRHDFADVTAFRGMLSLKNVNDPGAYERSRYVRLLEDAHQP